MGDLPVINRQYRSPNYSLLQSDRKTPFRPGALLIHSTEGSAKSAISWLCNPASRVSSHIVIAQTGSIFGLVDFCFPAWHAGVSGYNGYKNWNNFAIGIELERFGNQGYPDVQINALSCLSRALIAVFGIPQQMVQTHRAVAIPSGRKIDPVGWSNESFYAWSASLYTGAA